jgi:hypothetical protein
MARATECNLGGRNVSAMDAVSLRDAAKRNHDEALLFTCVECGRTVRPHKAGTYGVAHFEQHTRNPQCSLSDPERRRPLTRFLGRGWQRDAAFDPMPARACGN